MANTLHNTGNNISRKKEPGVEDVCGLEAGSGDIQCVCFSSYASL